MVVALAADFPDLYWIVVDFGTFHSLSSLSSRRHLGDANQYACSVTSFHCSRRPSSSLNRSAYPLSGFNDYSKFERVQGAIFANDEAGFIAGVIAASVSTTRKIGMVTGIRGVPALSQINGGAKVNDIVK
jgi:hypothetical protein